MMQFSVAPWRILDDMHMNACKQAIEIRKEFTPLILRLAKESSKTGEPIVRPMAYVFPHQGYDAIDEQFMLGDSILVAPVIQRNAKIKEVFLPKGKWLDDSGVIHNDNRTIMTEVTIARLPYYKRL